MKWLSGYGVALLALLALPIIVVIAGSLTGGETIDFPPDGVSMRWYVALWESREFVESAITSLVVATSVCLIAGVTGALAGLALAKSRFRGRAGFEALLTAPLAVPAVAVGIALAIYLSSTHLTGTKTGLIIAHTVLALPFVLRMVRSNLAGYSWNIEHAAANLGANGWRVFWHVTLPLMRPGILGGMIFAFIVSFDEVVVALFLAGPGAMTLPARIFTYLDQSPGPIVLAAGSLLTGFAVVLMILLEWTVRIGRAFGVTEDERFEAGRRP